MYIQNPRRTNNLQTINVWKWNCNSTVGTSDVPDTADVAVGLFRSALP